MIDEEDGSNLEVKNMVKRLKNAIGLRIAHEIKTVFKNSNAFDIWYANCSKADTQGAPGQVDWRHLAGVFIVKKGSESGSVEIILTALWKEITQSMIYYVLEAQRGEVGKGIDRSNVYFVVGSRGGGRGIYKSGGFGASAGLCIIVTFILFVLLNLSEKEDKILMLMQLNGVTINGYLVSQLVYYFIMELGPFIIGVTCLCLNPNLQVVFAPFHLFYMLLIDLDDSSPFDSYLL